MPYMNKRNRFVQAAKQFADSVNKDYASFTKTELLVVAQNIGMKGVPTWVLKDYRNTATKGHYDLTSLINPVTV